MKLIITILFCLLSSQAVFAEDLTWGIAGDAGKDTKHATATRESLKESGVFNLIMPGDNLYNSNYKTVWSPWSDAGFKFDVVAIGNHHGGYQKEVDFFKMPAEYYSKSQSGRVRFIVLNSDNTKTVKAQADFLEKELKAATEPFIFLVYHHPTYTLSHAHKWEEKESFQLALRPLLKTYRSKITALLLGHDHLSMFAEFADLPVVLAGSVHEVRLDLPINNTQQGTAVKTRWFFDYKPYWARLTVPEEGKEVKIEMVRAADQVVKCSVSIETGLAMKLNSDCG